MVRLITILVLMVCSTLIAQTQYDQGMQKAFGLWKEGRNSEAAALFERISSAEKDNWLPSYYVALINTIQAFEAQDKKQISALLEKAQAAQDNADMISPNNPELMVTQALIHTAWIVYDPMANGMTMSGKANALYNKALAIAPDNPRVVLNKAEFDMGSAAYFGKDTKPMCAQVERAISLFATFKPESAYHPKWGLERAQEVLKQCKQ
jgi:tetratricopeptide (TPR) repeat protein